MLALTATLECVRTMIEAPEIDDEAGWQAWRSKWSLRDDTIYLNHGSFGPPPNVVRAARRRWIDRLDDQPMDFFVRKFEPALFAARERLAEFVQTGASNLVFAENATSAMNVVAANHWLTAGDEVLLTDHVYGAVQRIWDRACQRAGAVLRRVDLPLPAESAEQVVESIFAAVNQQTRLIVVSHITSPTAMILPVAAICRQARSRGIAVCIDGPHAVAHLPLSIDRLDCDYYTASCHKWLSAPFGSGFLYVHPRHQEQATPLLLSWGRSPPTEIENWDDEFVWTGTRDPSPYLSIPTAIDFLSEVGLDRFRARTHHLAQYARRQVAELTGLEAPVPDSPDWYGAMCLAPLPPVDRHQVRTALWERYGIEVPIIEFDGKLYVRISCHLYNTRSDIEQLLAALRTLL